jgi:hypothetical protein
MSPPLDALALTHRPEVRFWRDTRYGGMERWFLSVPPEDPMRIPDEWLKAVFFLGMERTRRGVVHKELVGTGFYYQVDNEFDASLHRIYFVTARHVIEGAQSERGSFHIRVNTEDGGSIWAETSKTDWVFHDDRTIDVAVLAPTFAQDAPRGLEST